MAECESRVDRALRLFDEGCSCSQAVFAVFCDIANMEEKQAIRLASSFGGGMCGMRETCGAVTGMLMAVGAICGYNDAHDPRLKAEHYAKARSLVERFVQEQGAISCRELLQKRAPQLPETKRRPCAVFVAQAVTLADELLIEKQAADKPI